jgi:ATP-dependent Clp endopeptidase proteolytic subunit ClpP
MSETVSSGPRTVSSMDPKHLVALATADKLAAERDHFLASARKERADAGVAEITLERAQESRRLEVAGNEYNHVYFFNGSTSNTAVTSCLNKLSGWRRSDPACDIEIVFNSPGGSVVDGLALYDYIQELRRDGHKVTTSTIGYAASMAGILLQAGDVRVMGAESWLLLHEASFGSSGKIGEVEDTVEWVKKISNRILDIFAARCAGASDLTATKRLNRRQLVNKWTRKDWWIDSGEALAYGLIDEIR